MSKLFLSLLFIINLISVSVGQNHAPCATDETYNQQLAQHPELAKAREQANQMAAVYQHPFNKANGIIYIPVVFHIIHQNGLENISQEQIMNQITILNQDFRKKVNTPGFSNAAVASDVQIEFRLAQYDPAGKKTDGIIRINNALTNDSRDEVKALSYWNSNRYLNIWVVKSISASIGSPGGTVLGYAQFPFQQSTSPTTDGVVIRSDYVGVIGSGKISGGGRTLTHEIGHWLGLFHTFQDGCVGGTSGTCASQGDGVCDTPPVAEANFGCDTTINSCNNDVPNLPDQTRNYMDYSDGACMNLFTAGQKSRMYANLSAFRNTIYGNGTNNVAYAGIDPATGNYLPVAAATLKAPQQYGFENGSLLADGWILNNFNNPTKGWQYNTTTAFSGSASMFIPHVTNTTSVVNGRDGFQSPNYDLTTVANPFVEFYYAHAQKSASNADSLILFLTPNFGMTEYRIFAQRAPELATGGPISTEFIPAASEWRKVSINLAPYKSFTNARFRFELLSRRGNNTYIDQFSISNGATNVNENSKNDFHFTLFPNPLNEYATLQFVLKEADFVTISIKDITGKTIELLENNLLTSGSKSIEIHKKNKPSGLYFVEFKGSNALFIQKLIIQ